MKCLIAFVTMLMLLGCAEEHPKQVSTPAVASAAPPRPSAPPPTVVYVQVPALATTVQQPLIQQQVEAPPAPPAVQEPSPSGPDPDVQAITDRMEMHGMSFYDEVDVSLDSPTTAHALGIKHWPDGGYDTDRAILRKYGLTWQFESWICDCYDEHGHCYSEMHFGPGDPR